MITTKRLFISQITSNDVELIYNIFTDPVCIRFIGDRGIRTPSDAEHYIKEKFQDHYRNNGFAMYKVSLKNSIGIGICGLIRRQENSPPDLGFAFVTEYRGGGYCTEAGSAILNYEQGKRSFTSILAYTSPENIASKRVLGKLGFVEKQTTRLEGQNFDSVIFELKKVIKMRTGGCLCRQIKYEFSGEPLVVHACHCRQCQKISSSAYGVNMWIEAKDLNFKTGELKKFTTQGGSGQDHDVYFCGDCGTAICSRYHAAPKPFVFLRSGTLDESSDIKPDVHIFLKDRQAGIDIDVTVPQYDGYYHFKEVWSSHSQERFKRLLREE